MSNGITLTSSMRSALLSLQSTEKLYTKTQNALTTGKKVSSPSDDPAAYYSAYNLNNQATALTNRLDNMDQAVQAIKAADNGISSMESVLSSITAIVESAMASSSTDSDTRAALGKKFNDLLVQMSTLANDSAYGGTNLLTGQDLTVQMGENYNGSTYTVDGFYVAGLTQSDTDANGEVSNIISSNIPTSWGTGGAAAVTNFAFALNMVENPSSVIGIKSFGTVSDTYDVTGATIDAAAYSTHTASGAGGSYYVNVYENTSGVDGYKIDWTDSSTYTSTLSSILDEIESVKSVLETRDSLLAYDSSTITLRESYTNDFITTLQDGSDSLTLADENEESANLLSLETSQSLAVQAMSMSNTQMQNVLRLLQS